MRWLLLTLLLTPMPFRGGEPAFKLRLTAGGRTETRAVDRIELARPRGGPIEAKWDGRIVAAQRGDCVFTAKVRGVFKLTINGRLVLEGAGDSIAQPMDARVPLEAGANLLAAEFASDGTEDAFVELTWKQ